MWPEEVFHVNKRIRQNVSVRNINQQNTDEEAKENTENGEQQKAAAMIDYARTHYVISHAAFDV